MSQLLGKIMSWLGQILAAGNKIQATARVKPEPVTSDLPRQQLSIQSSTKPIKEEDAVSQPMVPTMELKTTRYHYDETTTIGHFTVDDSSFCYSLEDVVRPAGAVKVPGATAIPAGRYRVLMQMSAHFGRMMPHLQAVPGFDLIMIHGGNTNKDTLGCILVAFNLVNWDTIQSQASDGLNTKINAALTLGREVWCTVEDTQGSVLSK